MKKEKDLFLYILALPFIGIILALAVYCHKMNKIDAEAYGEPKSKHIAKRVEPKYLELGGCLMVSFDDGITYKIVKCEDKYYKANKYYGE
jgi:hypothetical protein